MPYLVDGNNVMALTIGWHRDKSAARRRFIQELAVFVAVHRAKVKVVFDGAPDDEFPEGCKFKSVHILYARYGSDADSRIKELIEKSSHKRNLILVSSDRALVSHARGRVHKVISAGTFRTSLDDAARIAKAPDKSGQEKPVNVDEWLEFFEKSGKDSG
jgi:predicted RNA-binding protein with PIN domain